jgi:hypothetical protein
VASLYMLKNGDFMEENRGNAPVVDGMLTRFGSYEEGLRS